MSKSKGNVVSPDEVIKQYGAEVLRLWVASENYQEDVRISPDILKRLSEAYRKIRNTWRFMLGTLSDFDPARDAAPYASLEEIDKWALCRFAELVKRVTRAYDEYEFHAIYHAVTNFCITDMSAVYLDVLKDRLYCSAAGDPLRKTAQTTLDIILRGLLTLLSPILSFTSDEAWQFLPGAKEDSVHLAAFPELKPEYENADIARKWDVLLALRDRVLKQLETARANKEIGNALEAAVTLTLPQALHDFLEPYKDGLADIFIVSQLAVTAREHAETDLIKCVDAADIAIGRAQGEKCQRCWKYFTAGGPDVCPRCAAALL